MEVHLELIVRSTEIDVNGHVNNAKYLEYLEWGREEWYEKNHLTYQSLLDLGIQTVTVNITIDYLKECTQGESLTVSTSPERAGNTSFVLLQKIQNAAGDLTAKAKVTLVTIDSHSRKATPLPQVLRSLFE